MNIENLKHYVMDLNKLVSGTFNWKTDSAMKDGYYFYFLELHGSEDETSKELYTNTFDLTEKQFDFIYGDNHFDLDEKNLEKWLENILILLNRNKLNDLVKGLTYLSKLTTEEAADKSVSDILGDMVTEDLDMKFWSNYLAMEKPELMPYLHEEFSLSVQEVNSIFWSDGTIEDPMKLMINNINTLIEKEI